MKVVIADDSVLIRERLQNVLSTFRQVELLGTYNNGTDTLEALRNLKPDLAIVDIKMPGLNGLEVLTETRKENKTIQFIILTFHATEYYRRMAMEAGVNYFFSKADDFEKVAEVVEEINESKKGNTTK